ncbi:hypothetical protein [Anabaena sp. UHCC 0187]|uniref:hypothetical protein n=1 Tax=Anabaena sp. UHCC 0187 TaxID=2590018 RepID=UPI001580C49A|nr:hypothetical protein [Anabaena sp. UHCC 0187]
MQGGNNIYAKLTEIIIPVVFDKPVLNINIITTVPVGKVWEYGGKVRQVVSTALGNSITEESPLSLVERNLITFSKVAGDYTLRYKPPKWFIDLTIAIYQYDGSDTSAAEIDLARIEAKIDALTPP